MLNAGIKKLMASRSSGCCRYSEVLKFRRCDLLTNMRNHRNLFAVYIEVEGNKIIAKESGVSFDLESDVWSRHPGAPFFGDRPVHNKFSLKCPGTPSCYYGVAYAANIRSPHSIRHLYPPLISITNSERKSYENTLALITFANAGSPVVKI